MKEFCLQKIHVMLICNQDVKPLTSKEYFFKANGGKQDEKEGSFSHLSCSNDHVHGCMRQQRCRNE
jgi:hypothetical protein